ncbi:LCP family protein [Rhodococcus erythropolis]|uniref:LCP family protein n=1 Tax=Rhodococcus erythropolis TaxID=1833 RepID=A0AAX3V297_RHOER|nr:LCP family protein [Rhodococcus erythropolis]WGV48493.2 LCP family protein [Rhodococcus erythropolis]
MGDDHDSGPPPPESRAPWERPLADKRFRNARPDQPAAPQRPATPQRPAPQPPSPPERRSSGRTGRRDSPPTDDSVSVAELVRRVGDKKPPPAPAAPPKAAPTKSVPPRTPPPSASAPPPARPIPARPTVPPAAADWITEEHPVTSAVPRVVGDTGATRLAQSKIRRRHRAKVIGRSAVAFLAVMSLALTGVVWGYLRSVEGGFDQIAALDTESDDIIDAGGQLGDETYLIIGTDTRAGASGEIGAGTVEDAEGARADTVMLVNIPADRSRVVAVSFPRDLDVERPICQGWDNDAGKYTSETFPAASGDKLNATYALGGPKCLVKVIQKMSGLKIGHFVGMDFAGFERMVDTVGGVNVCSPGPIEDGILGTVLASGGTQMLDGRTALNYVRARHVEAEGNGDYGRITRQQKFLSALLRSALSNQVLLNPSKLNGFINAFTSDTFVENIDTKSLVTLGRSLQNVDAGAVTFLTVPTDGTNDWGNEIPRTDEIKSLFQAIIDDEPLPGEEREDTTPSSTSSTTTPPTSSTPPAATSVEAMSAYNISVDVSNASGIAGQAATIADSLAAYGFQISTVGNFSAATGLANAQASTTVVRYAAGYEAEAVTVASSIPGAVLVLAPSMGDMIEVVVGSNFAGTVVAPADPGTILAANPTSVDTSTSTALPADIASVNAGDTTCD